MVKTISKLKRYGHQATAVMGAAYLEHALGLHLKNVFKKLDKDDEPVMFDPTRGILGTFGAKIRIAYALGILHFNPYRAFLLINDIRNVFAHSLYKVDFNHKDVVHDCQQLASMSDTLAVSAGLAPLGTEPAIDIYTKIVQMLYFSLRFQIQNWIAESAQQRASPDRSLPPAPTKDQVPNAGNDNSQ